MQQSREDHSVGELFADLTRQTSTLVRQEVQLAKTEMSDTATRVGKDIGFLAVGGAVAYAGFLGIMAAVIILLAEVIPWWLSALIVGLAVAGAGYLLVQRGREQLKQTDMAPHRTIDTLKEDAEWAKKQVS